MLRTSTLLLGLLIAARSLAQTSSQRASVPLSAVVQKNPAMITLSWTSLPSTSSITIYRKLKTATSWGSAIANPSASSLSYQDYSVVVGTAYEYRVVRISAGVTGQGYICTGIEVPLADYKGKIILLVDNTFTTSLATELAQLQNDLRADGWAVVRSDVSRTASVSSVRNTVIGHYNSDPANVKALFIVGHVPVPYSGNLNPDGHSEHLGAWPCDGYYGELNGTWTDNSVNSQGGQRVQNHNVPGDGKFDQSYFPSDLELQVGRVDMYDMPAFSQSETQLLSAYLTKLHNYKIKQWTPQARGIIFDNLQWVTNPLSASGWRNLIPMVGAANITAPDPYAGNFSNYINNQSYLWTYNSGGGLQAYEGSTVTYNGADLIGTTQTYASMPGGGVFNMSFGSYYGDWDNKNNFLRAPLASGNGLVNCYASIPAWYFHHMGLGENIGYSALVTMNNNSLYTPITDGWQSTIGKAHLGLMGDPSLRQRMIAPPTNLSITNASGTAAFSWTAAPGSPDGYHLYRFDATTGVITRLTTNVVTGTSYSSGTIPFVAGAQYMVRAVKLQVDPSGSYFNLSLGAIGTAAGSAPVDCLGVPGGTAVPGSACNDGNACTINDVRNASCQCVGTSITPTATITPGGSTGFCSGGSVVLNASTGTGYTYVWQRNGTTISGATSSSYTATQAGSYTVIVTNSGCGVTSSAINVTVTATPTATITAGGSTGFCSGGGVALNANTGTGYTYVWKRNGTTISGAASSSYTATQAGSYTVTVSSVGCSATSAATTVTVGTAPSATISAGGSTTFCTGGSVALNANTGTGYTYVWKRNGTTISGASSSSYTATQAGSYTVTVSNAGCATTSAGTTVTVNAGPTATITAGGATSFCTGGSVALSANTGTGYTYIWKRNGTTISGATSSSYTATQAGSYTVTVSSVGCSATSAATTVTVGTAPSATISAGGSTTFCTGGSVALNANTGTGYTYVWKRNGTTISGASSSSYTATQAGSYTVTVSNAGCATTSAGTTVTVNAGPTATLTAGGPTSFCTGGSVVLSASTGSGYSYVWKRNGTTISGATSSSYTAALAGSYTVTITSGACTATSSALSVTVSTAPSASMTAGSPTTFCSGGVVTLTANSGTGYTYVWKLNGTTISGATGISHNATAAGSYTVTVTNGACSTTSSSTAVTVNPLPTASCSSNASAATVSAVGSGTLAPYTYSWNTTPVQTGATITVPASGNYTATVTDARGCRGSCTSTITLVPPGNCTGTRTETQTTWGATASDSNPAAYMTSNFANAFPAPNYLTIGCNNRTLKLTSAAAVTAFLPSSGPTTRLPYGVTQNPGTSYGNTLAGQLVALKLSVRFDELSASFSPSNTLLKNMVIASGTFTGWTVQQLIDAADSKIGGCGGTYSRATLNTAITAVNEGYAGGTVSSGYLACPASGMMVQTGIEEAIDVPEEEALEVSVFPNPVRGMATFVIIGAAGDEATTLELFSVSGVRMTQLFSGTIGEGVEQRVQWDAGSQMKGMYFYRVVSGVRTSTGKVVVD